MLAIRYNYWLEGATILKETWGENTLIPLYDTEDAVCGIIYNDTPYYFHKNLQGDIIAISDSNANVVARYTYDAWGKCTNISGSNLEIANINPFRYRSYYFDQDTGLYYLQSRYYDPEIGRFVNADEAEIATMRQGAIEHNLFTYCLNNPMMNSDPTGKIPIWLKISIGIVGIIASVVATIATGGAAFPALVASLKFVVGNVAISMAISGLIGYLTGGVSGLKKGLIEGAADGFMWGGIGAALTAASAAIRFGGKMTVYTSTAANGTTQYVGITNNFARRAAEHLAKKGIKIQKLLKGLNPKCARAVEQCLIEYYGLMKNGGTLINRINSIAKSNKKYAEALKLGWYLLKRAGFKG